MDLLAPSKALTRRFVLPDGAVGSSPESPDEVRILRRGCRVGDVPLLISQEAFGELIPRTGICALPNVQEWCLGLVNVRGNLVPVFDMHTMFDASDGPPGKWVLVLGQGPDAVGITVDELPGQLLLRAEERLDTVPDSPAALSAFVTGAYAHEGQVWFEFDYEELFRSLAKQVSVHAA